MIDDRVLDWLAQHFSDPDDIDIENVPDDLHHILLDLSYMLDEGLRSTQVAALVVYMWKWGMFKS